MPEKNWNSFNGEQLLEELQSYAVEQGISDIHTSPEKEHVRLEVRVHGMLKHIADLKHDQYTDFVRRIKFASKLKLNLTNVPQDGQFTFDQDSRTVNVRTATIPSRFGEKITLRILDPKRGIRPLNELGFPQEIAEQLHDIATLPHGLFLVTGPTGSGKTTTLYALLNSIIGTSRNIMTLEDPIEYELEGIVQSEVDYTHDYTFSNGLRSILRHDPDVVLVGEIRDLETAQTAIDAALTGHLVLSTLHTNSAVEAIPRLLSMGVSPYTFAPALRGVLAQRLVRTLSPECKDGTCDPADQASYDGRMSLPELLILNEDMREMILLNESADVLLEKAKESDYKTMADWGEELLEKGVTTKMEVERVTI